MFAKHNTSLKIMLYSLIMLVLYLFQSVPSLNIRFMGRAPELLLVLTICVAFHESETFAAFFGLFAGLLNDVVTDSIVGKSALFFMFAAFLIAVLLQTMIRNFFLSYIFISLITIAIYLLSGYLFNLLFLSALPFLKAALEVLLPKFLFTGVLTYPVYFIIHFVHSRLETGGDGI